MTGSEQTATTAHGGPRHVRVGIVGAGFGGVGTAIRLKQEGEHDFVIWERDGDVGGTWWANTYPGCQCDIPSHLYSFSFALNPDWTRTYATQPEIRDYLRGVAEQYDLYPHLRAGSPVSDLTWDDEAEHWRVETPEGTWTADVVIAAPGGLSEPSYPDVPGLEDFGGEVMHTARWNHEVDLRGKRVAVIGTGASAIQAVPQIQPLAEKLTVFQRTPPWVTPHRDRPITDGERRLYRRLPAAQRAVRSGVYAMRELLVPGLVHSPRFMKVVEGVARKHIADQVADPELRAKVTPGYEIGCKRILPSNKWYPALQQPNVELVTSGLREVRPDGVVGEDGVLHEADVIVFATGFFVTDIPLAHIVRGRGGEKLADVWDGSPQAYRGTAIAGFPNLFLLTGPNVGLGHNSIVFMIEAQLNYLMDALRTMRERGAASVEVRREAQDAYNARIQQRMPGTVWNRGGCSSWYIDAKGRNTTIWPDFTWRFWRETRQFDPAAYELAPARSRAGEPERVAA